MSDGFWKVLAAIIYTGMVIGSVTLIVDAYVQGKL